MKRAFISFVLAAGLACGGSSNNSGSIPGGGNVATQLAFVVQPTSCSVGGQTLNVAAVIVAQADQSISNACTVVGTCTNYKNLNTAAIAVSNFSLSGAASAVGTGTYNVGTPTSTSATSFATVSFGKTDANCVETNSDAKSGTVSLTKVGSTVEGTYDVTMADGSKKSGSFSGTVCSNSFAGDLCGSGTANCTGATTCL